MNKIIGFRIRAIVASALTGVLLLSNSASAADPFTLNFPAGVACEFALQVDGTGGNSHTKVFKNGVMLTAGTGSALTFTNLSSADTLSLKSNGFSSTVTINPDGTQTIVSTGNFVVVLFPTDTPAGPSTTLWAGYSTATVDTLGNFHLGKTVSHSADICAALS